MNKNFSSVNLFILTSKYRNIYIIFIEHVQHLHLVSCSAALAQTTGALCVSSSMWNNPSVCRCFLSSPSLVSVCVCVGAASWHLRHQHTCSQSSHQPQEKNPGRPAARCHIVPPAGTAVDFPAICQHPALLKSPYTN